MKHFHRTISAFFLTMALLCSCTNDPTAGKKSSIKNSTTNSLNGSVQGNVPLIQSVTVGKTSNDPTLLYFSTSTPGANTVCTSLAGCLCEFRWTQVNGTFNTIRTKYTSLRKLQNFYIECGTDSEFLNLPAGTEVLLSLVTNKKSLTSIAPYRIYRGGSSAQGDFQDEQGRSFFNIHRYTCFDHSRRGELKNLRAAGTNASGTPLQIYLANKFCIAGQNNNGTSCGADEISSQSYYYNLFIPSSQRGNIIQSNQAFTCPLLVSSNRYTPLDSSFALSSIQSNQFNIAVEGPIRLSGGGQTSQQVTTCAGTVSSNNTSTNSILNGCLGFAAKALPNGVCGTMLDQQGVTRKMYRLRRYITIFPPRFDSGGINRDQMIPHTLDTLYVLDRPVDSGTPGVEFTMLGPKPCPFAFFDKRGSVGAGSSGKHFASFHSGWRRKNIDGIQFPNFDRAPIGGDPNTGSCAAIIPLPGLVPTNSGGPQTNIKMSLGTTHAGNANLRQMPIRPTRSWSPDYIEDTDFVACAPLASALSDPPIHLVKSGNNVSYCAEVYPTDNTAGGIPSKTTHTPKNALGSCPSSGCDRSISYAGPAPLLASDADLENLNFSPLIKSNSYQCLITYDGGKGGEGKISPAQGCCGRASEVWSGPTPPAGFTQTAAHLEEDTSGNRVCAVPKIVY